MKGSVQIVSAFISIIILLLLFDRSEGDSRSEIIRLTCGQHYMDNLTVYIPNFTQTMDVISTQIQMSNRGTAVAGTEPYINYALAECYGDLSPDSCTVCYAEAHYFIPQCFPYIGSQVFLDGCFMRTENYNFFEEYKGPHDMVICGNTTRYGGSLDSVRQAILDAVSDAPKNRDYFARKEAISKTTNESAYVLADCWGTLNETSCTKCLEMASVSILKCLPWSEGRALHTGCFMRYSNTNFLNADPNGGNNGGNAKSQLIQRNCQKQQVNNGAIFNQNFMRSMAHISTTMRASKFGTIVTGTEPDTTYGLAQCYGDVSTHECNLCSAEALTSLRGCLPSKGGRVYLNGCFMRYENYNFFKENTGDEDRIICENKTRMNNDFEQSASKAVFQTVEAVPKSKDYHAGIQIRISGTGNKSVDATADCWRTLDAESCAYCLQKAARSMLSCLPVSQGYALHSGCFMKYTDSNFLNYDHKTISKGKFIAIVMAVTSVVAFLIASFIAFYAWKRRSKSKRRKGSDTTKLSIMVNCSSLNFKYSTIEKATGSFDEANKLGQGGFGTVYKGVLPDGREIAAKRLFFNQRHRGDDFYHEVNIISSVDHKNLVKLLGFSCLGPESILVYEYLPNKSLNHFIFDAVRGKELNWGKRFDIIMGIAEGLAYLHENSKTRIIHRDIKAANILLDSRLCAKIADFGLARSFEEDKNHISTGIAGTLGYMAPEYVMNGKLTEKVDVYSFGVLLLEVVTGIPNRGIQIQSSDDTQSLLSITWRNFQKGTMDELFDEKLMLDDDTSNSMKKEIKSVIHIGLLCTQEIPSLRPSMSMTLQMLSKNIEPLPSPSNPPCIHETDTNEFGQTPALRLRVNNPASLPTVTHGSFSPR